MNKEYIEQLAKGLEPLKELPDKLRRGDFNGIIISERTEKKGFWYGNLFISQNEPTDTYSCPN